MTLIVFGRSDFFQPRFRWQVARMLHLQRLKYVDGCILVQRQTRDALYHKSQNLKIDVAVDELRPRRIDRLLVLDHPEGVVATAPGLPKVQVRAQTRIVRHELTDSDLFFTIGREFGNEFSDG